MRTADNHNTAPRNASRARGTGEENGTSGFRADSQRRPAFRGILLASILLGSVVLLWLAVSSGAVALPVPHAADSLVAILNVGTLVFREGLECILVLAALTAGMSGDRGSQRRPIVVGAAVGFIATLVTWHVAVGAIADLSTEISPLEVQAATGLLAVIVLLTVMNWFFHRMYWTGWISLHNKKKRDLIGATGSGAAGTRLLWGLGLLGFSSLYREGFEVVLFLQSYRLRLGGIPVLYGALLGLGLSGVVAVLTFVVHRHLPYRKMLVLTGMLLGIVLLVMVGEQAQEMQLAGWLPSTPIRWLSPVLPAWAGMWFSVFPNLETLLAQAAAGAAIIGSYVVAERRTAKRIRAAEMNEADTVVNGLPPA
jgi:high-affinity iron transporter